MLLSTVAVIRGQHGDMPQVRDDPNAFFVTAELGVRSFLGPRNIYDVLIPSALAIRCEGAPNFTAVQYGDGVSKLTEGQYGDSARLYGACFLVIPQRRVTHDDGCVLNLLTRPVA